MPILQYFLSAYNIDFNGYEEVKALVDKIGLEPAETLMLSDVVKS